MSARTLSRRAPAATTYHALSTLAALATRVVVGGKYWNMNFTLLWLQSVMTVVLVVVLHRLRVLPGLASWPFSRGQLLRFLPVPLLSFISGYLHLHALQTISLPSYVLLTALVPLVSGIVYAPAQRLVLKIAGTSTSTSPTHPRLHPRLSARSLLLLLLGIYVTQSHDWKAAHLARGDQRSQYRIEPWEPVRFLVFAWLFVGGAMAIDVVLRVYTQLVTTLSPAMQHLNEPVSTLFADHLVRLIPLTIFAFSIEDFSADNLHDNFARIAHSFVPTASPAAPSSAAASQVVSQGVPMIQMRGGPNDLLATNRDSLLVDNSIVLLAAFTGLLILPTALALRAAYPGSQERSLAGQLVSPAAASGATSYRKNSVATKHGNPNGTPPFPSSSSLWRAHTASQPPPTLSRRLPLLPPPPPPPRDVLDAVASVPISLCALLLLPMQGGVHVVYTLGLAAGLAGSVSSVLDRGGSTGDDGGGGAVDAEADENRSPTQPEARRTRDDGHADVDPADQRWRRNGDCCV